MGGAIYANLNSTIRNLYDCHFLNNQAGSLGGAVYLSESSLLDLQIVEFM